MAAAGDADVTLFPGQSEEGTPVDGSEGDPLVGHAELPIPVVRHYVGVVWAWNRALFDCVRTTATAAHVATAMKRTIAIRRRMVVLGGRLE